MWPKLGVLGWSFHMTARINMFRDHSDWSDMGTKPLSCAEASLCRRKAGEKEKENAGGTMGRGKREERLSRFPSSHRAPRAFYFSTICYFYWDSQRKLLRRRREEQHFSDDWDGVSLHFFLYWDWFSRSPDSLYWYHMKKNNLLFSLNLLTWEEE